MTLDHGILIVDSQCHYRLRIQNPQISEWPVTESVFEAIERRIYYYRHINVDFTDFCTILAILDGVIPTSIAERMMQRLQAKHASIQSVMHQSSFLLQDSLGYHFQHEHYQAVFRQQKVQNKFLLSGLLRDLSNLPDHDPQAQFSKIKLLLAYSSVDFNLVRRQIVSLLSREISQSMEISLYKLLLNLPSLPESSEDIPTYEVLFQITESFWVTRTANPSIVLYQNGASSFSAYSGSMIDFTSSFDRLGLSESSIC